MPGIDYEALWREAYNAAYGCDPTHPPDAYSNAYAVIRTAFDAALAEKERELADIAAEFDPEDKATIAQQAEENRRLRESDTYAAWQQKRGMLADKVDWAINEYDEFMKDDAFDSQRVLDRIVGGLRETRTAFNEGADNGQH